MLVLLTKRKLRPDGFQTVKPPGILAMPNIFSPPFFFQKLLRQIQDFLRVPKFLSCSQKNIPCPLKFILSLPFCSSLSLAVPSHAFFPWYHLGLPLELHTAGSHTCGLQTNFLFSTLCLVLHICCLYFFAHFPIILCACFQDVLLVSEKTDILPLAGFGLCCSTSGCFPANMMSLDGCKPSCRAHSSKQWLQLKLGFEKSMFLLVTVGWTQSHYNAHRPVQQ